MLCLIVFRVTVTCVFRLTQTLRPAALDTGEAAALGASASAAPGAGESALSVGPVAVSLVDPSGGPVLASFSTVLPCPAAPSGTLSVHSCESAGDPLHVCSDGPTLGPRLPVRRGSSLYTLTTESPPVAESGQVAASSQVFAAASRSGPESAPCSCRLLSHQTLLWHHRLGHPSLPSSPKAWPHESLSLVFPGPYLPYSPGPAPTCVPCVEGRQRAAPHSSEFPPTEAPLQTLHMDRCGAPPASVATGIRQTFTLPASPHQNGIAERRIGMVMDVARTSMIHAAAPHFLWPFAVHFTTPPRAGVLSSQDVTFDESVPYYRLFPYRTAPPPPAAALSLRQAPPLVDPLPPQGPAPSGVSQVDAVEPVEVAVDSGAARGAEPAGAGSGGAEPEVAEPGGARSKGAEPGGAEPGGTESGGAEPGGAEPGVRSLGVLGLLVWPLAVLRRGGSYSLRRSCASGFARRWSHAAGAGVATVAASPEGTAELLAVLELPVLLELVLLELLELELLGGVGAGGSAGAESSLPILPDPERDSLGAASPTVTRLLAIVVTDPSFESTAASALVAELVDFAARFRLDYSASLVAESESVSPPSVGGECALSTDVLEDRQEEFQCFAAALPHLVSTLIAPEGDPDAPDIPTPRSYAEAIEGSYVDKVPPPGANIVSGMWIFRVKRPPGSPPVFKARYVARGFSQRQGVDYFQTFSPTPKMTTLRVLLHIAAQRDYELHSLDFSTAFLQGSLHEEIWLRRPPGFTGSFPPGTQWSLRRPVYGLRQAPQHMAAAKRVLRYLCSTSGLGLVLGGRRRVVLTGHADASWADDQATQRSSQGYTFSLGSGSVSWRSTRSSSVLGSSCEAEIYAGAMAAQELRWLTYLLTDLGEPPRSPPLLYVDNKAMLALCREHRLEHRTKHIALRYFLARELQQRGQLRLAYVASEANTADIFTKALPPGDHQRFCTMLGLMPTWPHLLTS
ncbi:unnamed protein product [Closterium sp. NIES-64]|nr:unnamed protein product [Closterium sp. NIES-64]